MRQKGERKVGDLREITGICEESGALIFMNLGIKKTKSEHKNNIFRAT